MSITLICPNLLCRSILQVPDSVRGRRVRCGKCGKDFLVPSTEKINAGKKAPAEAKTSQNQE